MGSHVRAALAAAASIVAVAQVTCVLGPQPEPPGADQAAEPGLGGSGGMAGSASGAGGSAYQPGGADASAGFGGVPVLAGAGGGFNLPDAATPTAIDSDASRQDDGGTDGGDAAIEAACSTDADAD